MMSKQAATAFYSDSPLALDLAAAVNEEVRDLFAAGADIVQLDEPWLERFPGDAANYGADVVCRAFSGIAGTKALHVCFGYGEIVADKPRAYHVLELLEDVPVDQVSIEAAQPGLDLSTVAGILPSNNSCSASSTFATRRPSRPSSSRSGSMTHSRSSPRSACLSARTTA